MNKLNNKFDQQVYDVGRVKFASEICDSISPSISGSAIETLFLNVEQIMFFDLLYHTINENIKKI